MHLFGIFVCQLNDMPSIKLGQGNRLENIQHLCPIQLHSLHPSMICVSEVILITKDWNFEVILITKHWKCRKKEQEEVHLRCKTMFHGELYLLLWNQCPKFTNLLFFAFPTTPFPIMPSPSWGSLFCYSLIAFSCKVSIFIWIWMFWGFSASRPYWRWVWWGCYSWSSWSWLHSTWSGYAHQTAWPQGNYFFLLWPVNYCIRNQFCR